MKASGNSYSVFKEFGITRLRRKSLPESHPRYKTICCNIREIGHHAIYGYAKIIKRSIPDIILCTILAYWIPPPMFYELQAVSLNLVYEPFYIMDWTRTKPDDEPLWDFGFNLEV